METKFYLIDPDFCDENPYEMINEEFMDTTEEQGSVYSLYGFEDAFNNEEVSCFTYILRILKS